MWTINKTFIKYVGPSSITELGEETLFSSDRINQETGRACVHLCVLEVWLQWQETLTYEVGTRTQAAPRSPLVDLTDNETCQRKLTQRNPPGDGERGGWKWASPQQPCLENLHFPFPAS